MVRYFFGGVNLHSGSWPVLDVLNMTGLQETKHWC